MSVMKLLPFGVLQDARNAANRSNVPIAELEKCFHDRSDSSARRLSHVPIPRLAHKRCEALSPSRPSRYSQKEPYPEERQAHVNATFEHNPVQKCVLFRIGAKTTIDERRTEAFESGLHHHTRDRQA